VADAQRHQAEAVGATVTIARDLPEIVADRLAIEQVFGNLLDNAVKYLDPSRPGRITVTAKAVGERGVCFSVADNGRGIAARDHARVFELFYHGTAAGEGWSAAPGEGGDSRRGMGLGLSLCRSILRAHGSDIILADAVPHGCVFSFTLPEAAVLMIEGGGSYGSSR